MSTLIERLKNPEDHYEFSDSKKANAVLMSLCQKAADALADIKQDLTPVQEPDWKQIAEDLRFHGLTLVKTATGYAVLKLGAVNAQANNINTAEPELATVVSWDENEQDWKFMTIKDGAVSSSGMVGLNKTFGVEE